MIIRLVDALRAAVEHATYGCTDAAYHLGMLLPCSRWKPVGLEPLENENGTVSEAPTQLLAECLIPPGFVSSSGLRDVVIGEGTSPQLSPTAAGGRGSWSATSSAAADSVEEGYRPLQTRVREAPKVKRTAARQVALIEPPDRGRPWDEGIELKPKASNPLLGSAHLLGDAGGGFVSANPGTKQQVPASEKLICKSGFRDNS